MCTRVNTPTTTPLFSFLFIRLHHLIALSLIQKSHIQLFSILTAFRVRYTTIVPILLISCIELIVYQVSL
jgi:hypothetical protein